MSSTEVQVFGLILDDETKTPVVILRAVEGEETLPIQIGLAEATAIAAAVEKIEMPRPMTHDLLLTCIEQLGGKLEKVEVVDLRDGTFYGLLYILKGRKRLTIDTRPSDAIALALRAHAPIFVADKVFAEVAPKDITLASKLQWLGFLHALQASAGEDKEEMD